MCDPVMAVGGLTAYANRNKLKSGWDKFRNTTSGLVGGVTGSVANWADKNLKIN